MNRFLKFAAFAVALTLSPVATMANEDANYMSAPDSLSTRASGPPTLTVGEIAEVIRATATNEVAKQHAYGAAAYFDEHLRGGLRVMHDSALAMLGETRESWSRAGIWDQVKLWAHYVDWVADHPLVAGALVAAKEKRIAAGAVLQTCYFGGVAFCAKRFGVEMYGPDLSALDAVHEILTRPDMSVEQAWDHATKYVSSGIQR